MLQEVKQGNWINRSVEKNKKHQKLEEKSSASDICYKNYWVFLLKNYVFVLKQKQL